MPPLVLDEPGLSRAWARAMLHLVDQKIQEIAPLVISITGYDDNGVAHEDPKIRERLDALLVATDNYDIEKVAFTIFPQEIWEIASPDRKLFYRLALSGFPDYQKMNARANNRGLYWERLMAFGKSEDFDGNQLEFILGHWDARHGKSVRKSLMQASTFDAMRDHDPNPRLHFPCLQQVSFVPTAQGLSVNAFYATQQLFYKGYGNFLGLSRLGAFMASQMGSKMHRLTIYVGRERMDGINRRDPRLLELLDIARARID